MREFEVIWTTPPLLTPRTAREYVKGYDGTISLESPQPNDEAVLRDIAFVREVYERVNGK